MTPDQVKILIKGFEAALNKLGNEMESDIEYGSIYDEKNASLEYKRDFLAIMAAKQLLEDEE